MMNGLKHSRLASAVAIFTLLIVVVYSVGWASSATREFSFSQELIPSDGLSEDDIGFGLPITVDEHRAFLSSYIYGNDYKGAVYYYEQLNDQWIEKQQLVASDGAMSDLFGQWITLDGNLALITASWAQQGPQQTGAVYAFEQINGVWTETQKIVPAEGLTYGHFGNGQVGLQGNTAMIGYTDESEANIGFVNVYERINGQWEVVQTLESPDEPTNENNAFGQYIVFNGSIVWIQDGGNDTIFGYEKVNGLWTNTITLEFGADQWIDLFWSEGDHLLAMAFSDENAYIAVFRRINGVWTKQPPLEPLGDLGLEMGLLHLDGDGETVVVGVTPYEPTVPDNVRFFKVYQFINGSWVNTQTISPEIEDEPDDYLELFVGIGGNSIMASLFTDPRTHGVYVYTEPDPSPTETALPPTLPPLSPTAPTPPDDPIELLVNGSFEVNDDGNQSPDGWKLKQESGDKLKCKGGEGSIVFDGYCAIQFKGGDGERSKLQQAIDLTAHAVVAGDSLALGGQVWAKGNVDSKVTLKVKYTSLPTDKIIIPVINPTDTHWTAFSELRPNPLLTIPDTPSEITLQIKNNSPSGKVRYDAVILMHYSTSLVPLGLPQ
jgi:hypothetical protein